MRTESLGQGGSAFRPLLASVPLRCLKLMTWEGQKQSVLKLVWVVREGILFNAAVMQN